MAVSGFTDENANRADLQVSYFPLCGPNTTILLSFFLTWITIKQAFLAYFRPDMNSNATYTLEELDGGEDDQTIYYAGAEAVSFILRPCA